MENFGSRIGLYTFIGKTEEYVRAKDIPGIDPETLLEVFNISRRDYKYARFISTYGLIKAEEEDPEAELFIKNERYLGIEKLLSLRKRPRKSIIRVYEDFPEKDSETSSDESYIPSEPEDCRLEYDSDASLSSESGSDSGGNDSDWEPPVSKRKTKTTDKKGIKTKKSPAVPVIIIPSPNTRKRSYNSTLFKDYRSPPALLNDQGEEIDVLDKITIMSLASGGDARPKIKARTTKEKILLLERSLQKSRQGNDGLETLEGLFQGINLIN